MIIAVKQEDQLQRLDSFLALKTNFSRSKIKKIMLEGGISLGGHIINDFSKKIKIGEEYEILELPSESLKLIPLKRELNILYEDQYLIVLNKSANLTVHPGAGNHQDTLVNILLHHLGDSLSSIGGVSRPGIVHRLDKDTTGVMIVAKNDEVHLSLANQIKNRELKRVYKALVWKHVSPIEGTINANIGRSLIDRKKMAVLRGQGKEAITHYKVIKYYSNIATFLECKLETGRTHQIRVHMANLGYQIIGDQVYGKSKGKLIAKIPDEDKEYIISFPRQALHSQYIQFRHPITNEILSFEAQLPSDIMKLLDIFERNFIVN